MIDWMTLGIFAGFLMTGLMVGLGVGVPLGHRHILQQLQQRSDQERKARLEQVKQRALTRVENSVADAVDRRRSYGILEESDLV